MKNKITCSDCHGSGEDSGQPDGRCENCGGAGFVSTPPAAGEAAHTPTPQDVARLRYYLSAANGRGRICGAAARLLKVGCIKRTNTGVYSWSLMITPLGRALFKEAGLE